MRPPIDETIITGLRAELPEFEHHYLDLLDLYEEDLTPETVLMELADFVANLIVRGDREAMLERCMQAVENLVAATEAGAELVAYSFLTELPLGSRQAAGAYFGPLAARLAELVYGGGSVEQLGPPGPPN